MERYQRIDQQRQGHASQDLGQWLHIEGLEGEFLASSDHEEDLFLDRFDRYLRASGLGEARLRSAGRSLAECALWDVEIDSDWGELDVNAWLAASSVDPISDASLLELAQAFAFWLGGEKRLSARSQLRVLAQIRLRLRPGPRSLPLADAA